MTELTRRTFLGGTAATLTGATAASTTASALYVGEPVYTTDNLHVRNGPGTGYAIIATAEYLTGGYVTDGPQYADGYEWWKVAYNGDDDNGPVEGWSAANWLAPADFAFPTTGHVESIVGDSRSWGEHKGVDISNAKGTNVHAARAGTVVTATWEDCCGYYMEIDHGNGFMTQYCHLYEADPFVVGVGDDVGTFQHVANMGNTGADAGCSSGTHLHFVIYKDGVYQSQNAEHEDDVVYARGIPRDWAGLSNL